MCYHSEYLDMCSMIVLTMFVENQGESGGLDGHNLS